MRYIFTGHVQGVGFRWAAAREAGARGLRGYVRNDVDGSVEAVFSGESHEVAAAVEALRARFHVADVQAHPPEVLPLAPQFEIRD